MKVLFLWSTYAFSSSVNGIKAQYFCSILVIYNASFLSYEEVARPFFWFS